MNIQKTITILTPSYNRGYLLERLYQSLVAQSCNDFLWMVVDDGSTDDTEKKIAGFIHEDKIDILYLKKMNGGKHTALNFGLAKTLSELVFIVDSDDYLTEDACETILCYHSKYRTRKDLCGYCFLKQFPDGKINDAEFPSDELIENYIECRINREIGGDKAEVFITSCLKEFPFPEFPNEKFLSEDVVWFRVGKKYKMVYINKVVYTADYLADGLTKKGKILKIMNPLGGMARSSEMMAKECKLKVRIKGALYYIVFGKFAKNKFTQVASSSKNRLMISLLYPIGYGAYRYYKFRYSIKS